MKIDVEIVARAACDSEYERKRQWCVKLNDLGILVSPSELIGSNGKYHMAFVPPSDSGAARFAKKMMGFWDTKPWRYTLYLEDSFFSDNTDKIAIELTSHKGHQKYYLYPNSKADVGLLLEWPPKVMTKYLPCIY